MAEMAKVFDPGFFEIRQVPTVVDDPHRIGFGESDPDPMVERIRRRVERRLNGQTHVGTVAESVFDEPSPNPWREFGHVLILLPRSQPEQDP
jgi:hypothetical protein